MARLLTDCCLLHLLVADAFWPRESLEFHEQTPGLDKSTADSEIAGAKQGSGGSSRSWRSRLPILGIVRNVTETPTGVNMDSATELVMHGADWCARSLLVRQPRRPRVPVGGVVVIWRADLPLIQSTPRNIIFVHHNSTVHVLVHFPRRRCLFVCCLAERLKTTGKPTLESLESDPEKRKQAHAVWCSCWPASCQTTSFY